MKAKSEHKSAQRARRRSAVNDSSRTFNPFKTPTVVDGYADTELGGITLRKLVDATWLATTASQPCRHAREDCDSQFVPLNRELTRDVLGGRYLLLENGTLEAMIWAVATASPKSQVTRATVNHDTARYTAQAAIFDLADVASHALDRARRQRALLERVDGCDVVEFRIQIGDIDFLMLAFQEEMGRNLGVAAVAENPSDSTEMPDRRGGETSPAMPPPAGDPSAIVYLPAIIEAERLRSFRDRWV